MADVKKSVISPKRIRIAALLSVMGPGVIAGLSDDDPAGITTYSVVGSKYGYQLLWVLVASTFALIVFQDLGARIGVVTRQGMIGLVRQKYGARSGTLSASALILANIGTMTAEFAGIAAAGELFGLSRSTCSNSCLLPSSSRLFCARGKSFLHSFGGLSRVCNCRIYVASGLGSSS